MSSLPVQLRAMIGAQPHAAESIQRVAGRGPAGSVHADGALPDAARRSCCRRAARRITDPWVSKVSGLLHRPAAVGKPANLSISGADRGAAASGSRSLNCSIVPVTHHEPARRRGVAVVLAAPVCRLYMRQAP